MFSSWWVCVSSLLHAPLTFLLLSTQFGKKSREIGIPLFRVMDKISKINCPWTKKLSTDTRYFLQIKSSLPILNAPLTFLHLSTQFERKSKNLNTFICVHRQVILSMDKKYHPWRKRNSLNSKSSWLDAQLILLLLITHLERKAVGNYFSMATEKVMSVNKKKIMGYGQKKMSMNLK